MERLSVNTIVPLEIVVLVKPLEPEKDSIWVGLEQSSWVLGPYTDRPNTPIRYGGSGQAGQSVDIFATTLKSLSRFQTDRQL
jgi:hypothetical protein